MKLLAVVFLGGAVLALAGCAGDVWDKPGLTQAGFRVDEYACQRDVRQSNFGSGWYAPIAARNFYRDCMESKGYVRQ